MGASVINLMKTVKEINHWRWGGMASTDACYSISDSTMDQCKRRFFTKESYLKKLCHEYYETKSGHCSGDPFLKCREKCCYKDYCNKGNILDTNDQVSSSNKAVFISDGVVAMGLLLGVSLVAFSVNYL